MNLSTMAAGLRDGGQTSLKGVYVESEEVHERNWGRKGSTEGK